MRGGDKGSEGLVYLQLSHTALYSVREALSVVAMVMLWLAYLLLGSDPLPPARGQTAPPGRAWSPDPLVTPGGQGSYEPQLDDYQG
ncbi:unnamed protein product [Boreogadus saida]